MIRTCSASSTCRGGIGRTAKGSRAGAPGASDSHAPLPNQHVRPPAKRSRRGTVDNEELQRQDHIESSGVATRRHEPGSRPRRHKAHSLISRAATVPKDAEGTLCFEPSRVVSVQASAEAAARSALHKPGPRDSLNGPANSPAPAEERKRRRSHTRVRLGFVKPDSPTPATGDSSSST